MFFVFNAFHLMQSIKCLLSAIYSLPISKISTSKVKYKKISDKPWMAQEIKLSLNIIFSYASQLFLYLFYIINLFSFLFICK